MNKIASLDFRGQSAQLIARRLRELGVYSEILPCTEHVDRVLGGGCTGIVLSAGAVERVRGRGPDARQAPARVRERREYGKAHLRLLTGGGLLQASAEGMSLLMEQSLV